MGDVLLGIAAAGIGALFCFRGYLTMRIVIPIWGAFAGFFVGSGLVAGLGGEDFLSSAAAWLLGIALAIVFGLLAYAYFEVCVALAMSAVGFVLATSLLVALGVTWSWLIVLVGVVVGVLLAVGTIIADLPMVLLTVLTALAGASVTVAGLMLMVGTIDGSDLGRQTTTEVLGDSPWWYLLYAVLAIGGIVAQLQALDRIDRSMRDSWAADGGRQMRRV
ncbi:MAG: DUF4203 domain-containing protein [Microthrixaceae bacterium]